ncbi:MAG: hypothetical protein AUJ75_04760 [Candidatus Omnitrophica bacterium CG1_02_49_10]|nr:MAG: hypothetical protein AUJ75_04760 [Candidatus Omnitrophica bacterium CG1_02_49_10]
MKTLLHVVATPRAEASRTLKVSGAFIDGLNKRYPGCRVDTLDLFGEKIPPLTAKRLDGKYTLLGGGDLSGESKDAWKEIISHIERFASADGYLISAPMWNFGIPYVLKHYIDVIVQPKYLFRYTDKGPEGLIKNKKMVIVTSRGGDYGPESPFHAYDHEEPYLKTVMGFIGITDIAFISAQPMDAMGPDVQREKIEKAKEAAEKAAEGFWK